MTQGVNDLINAIVEGDAAKIDAAFNSEMATRISDRLEDMRVSVAQSMFATEQVEEQIEEEVEDEVELTEEEVDEILDSITEEDLAEIDTITEEQIEEASYSAKAAKAGKDIGKPGKNFEKIAKKAGEKYGSEERGRKVAGAILAKLRAK
jgi:division protein CdvB (Snf7/Vps24/ESCRT-III family)